MPIILDLLGSQPTSGVLVRSFLVFPESVSLASVLGFCVSGMLGLDLGLLGVINPGLNLAWLQ